jgi:amidase
MSDMSRRTFGKLVGAAAVGAALPNAPMTPPADELCYMSAVELATRIRRKELSSRELVAANLARIEQVNSKVNAVVTLVAEQARADAARADEAQARGERLGALHGLPILHKDLIDTAGIRTTYGSPFFKDNVPKNDALVVARAKRAGAVTLGKTNTPEFGAGSQTFNTVFGATRNPYDVGKTCGGSSGGAAVSLACGMSPIASGSDTGGSLRNPAAFCNIVGFRPTPGRVPSDSSTWSPLSTSGPMARSVADVALFLSVIAGANAASPLSLSDDPARFAGTLDSNVKGARVGWWRNLGGAPVEPEVRRVVDANRAVFESLGCIVEEAEPDFSGVDEAFPTLRHLSYHSSYAALARQKPEWVKDTIKWEIAEAERQSAADVAHAMERQARMYADSTRFFQRYDYFVLPVTQVAPFDVNTPYPTSIDGTPMRSYIDWMRSCWYVTFMTNPAISMPAGFTSTGLPVGLQLVGRHRDEWSVLRMAYAFEQATQHGKRRPAV